MYNYLSIIEKQKNNKTSKRIQLFKQILKVTTLLRTPETMQQNFIANLKLIYYSEYKHTEPGELSIICQINFF